MHLLAIPSWYPSDLQPARGQYLQKQFVTLQQKGLNVGVVHVENHSMRQFSVSALQSTHFQESHRPEEGLPTIRVHGWNVWFRTPFRFAWRIRRTVRLAERYARHAGRPDILHAHSAQWAAAAARILSQRWQIPYVVTEHYSAFHRGSLKEYERALAAWGLRGAAQVFAVSSFLRDTLVQQKYVPAHAVQVLPNAVDTRYFHPPEKRVYSGSSFRWFTAASLNRRKGIDVLLHAFKQLTERTNARLHIAGAGGQEKTLVRLAGTLQISDHVHFLGPLSRQAVRAELWEADAYVCPSRIETFGIPIVEAMATGIPVVATDCGGPSDIIRPSNGVLAKPEDPSALAKAMLSLQHHISDYDDVVIRRYIKEHYSNDVICSELLRQYQSIIST